MGRPITTFNFKVRLQIEGQKNPICDAEFSECDGLEMTREVKSIREGGGNGRQIHLAGPVSYGQLALKRGMTDDFGLWRWFEAVEANRGLRGSGTVAMLSSDSKRSERLRFVLTGCLPVKLKAPSLSAKDGQIAIEEMQIAYETLTLKEPGS